MSLLDFLEKDPKSIMMEEMLERLKDEPERQYKYINETRRNRERKTL
mgnify:CR=1 FL=1